MIASVLMPRSPATRWFALTVHAGRVAGASGQPHRAKMTRVTSATVVGSVLVLLINVPGGDAQWGALAESRDTVVSAGRGRRLETQNTIGDLLRHPAFAGFAHLVLPWDDRAYDEQMPLTRIGSLLPYHTHVDPETVAAGLNRMIDDAVSGKTVFYRFYSDARTQQEPAKGNTGLFFFRGRPGAPFAVIAPGGGFSYVASIHEGFPYAVAIAARDTTRSCSGAGPGRAEPWRPRTWLRRSLTSSAMRRRSASAPPATPCGGVRRAREWPPRSVRTAWRTMEAGTLQSRQPS